MNAVVLAGIVLAAGASGTVGPEELTARIASRGAKVVLWEVFYDQRQWPVLVHGVSHGKQAWLDVAVLLRPAADAGASEQLDQAMAEALIHAPSSALRAMGDSRRAGAAAYEVWAVCGNVEAAGEDADRAAVLKWLRRQEAAVGAVKDSALRDLRQDCLDAIRKARVAAQERAAK